MFRVNGEKYEGDFVDGSPEGFGTCWYMDGSIYEGEWRNGKRLGEVSHESDFMNNPYNLITATDNLKSYEDVTAYKKQRQEIAKEMEAQSAESFYLLTKAMLEENSKI